MDAIRIERVYTAYSHIYDHLFGRVFERGRAALTAALGARRGQRVLEVGVGTGLLLPYYAGRCEVTGIDLCEGMLARARARVQALRLPRVSLECMDAGAMRFADDSFDAAVAAYVVTAVPDHRAVMREMVRVTRPGGRLLLLNHFLNGTPVLAALERALSPVFFRLGFRTDLSVDEVLEGLPLARLRVEKVEPFGLWYLVECRNEKRARRSA